MILHIVTSIDIEIFCNEINEIITEIIIIEYNTFDSDVWLAVENVIVMTPGEK